MFYVKGEPEIVRNTRRHILESFSDLQFQEEGHIYTLNGQHPRSASGVGDRFLSKPFDKEFVAMRYADSHGETPEYWIAEWEKNSFRATTLGTKTHEFGESMGYLRAGLPEMISERIRPQYHSAYNYLAPISPKEQAVSAFFEDLPSSYHLVLNEAMAYTGKNPDPDRNTKELLCGTFDMLYYRDIPGKEGFVILDYKTNKNLRDKYNREHGIHLLPPFDDMVQEDLGIYTIQLSLYALMLEDIGVEVVDRRLVWLKDDGGYETVSLKDVSDRLRRVL